MWTVLGHALDRTWSALMGSFWSRAMRSVFGPDQASWTER